MHWIAYHESRNEKKAQKDNTEKNSSLARVHCGLLVLLLPVLGRKLVRVLPGVQGLDELLDLR